MLSTVLNTGNAGAWRPKTDAGGDGGFLRGVSTGAELAQHSPRPRGVQGSHNTVGSRGLRSEALS